jgi:hypothetical protein
LQGAATVSSDNAVTINLAIAFTNYISEAYSRFFLKAFRNPNAAYFRFLKKSVANLKIRVAIMSMKIPMPKVVLEIAPVKFQ